MSNFTEETPSFFMTCEIAIGICVLTLLGHSFLNFASTGNPLEMEKLHCHGSVVWVYLKRKEKKLLFFPQILHYVVI